MNAKDKIKASKRGIRMSQLKRANEFGVFLSSGVSMTSISSTGSTADGQERPDEVAVKFIWDHGGDNVHLCLFPHGGSRQTLPMTKVTFGKDKGIFEVVVGLKKGRCEFR